MSTKKRALINMHTQLENIPKEWLNHVEPNIMRGSFLPCWLWVGPICAKGYPRAYYDYKSRNMRRMVAGIFYELPDDWYVDLACHNKQCLNPNHLRVRKFHPNYYSD